CQVNQLANYLTSVGVRAGHRVAIAIDRSVDMMACIMAIWKVGGSYIPIDVNYPIGRIEVILKDAAPAALIIQQKHFRHDQLLKAIAHCLPLCTVIYFDESDQIDNDNYSLMALRMAKELANGTDTKVDQILFANQILLTPEDAEQVIDILRYSLRQVSVGSKVDLMFKNPVYQIVSSIALIRENISFHVIDRNELETVGSVPGINTIITEAAFIDEVDALAWRRDGLQQYFIIDEYDPSQS